jgi:cell division septum initiation protein DivIVA
MTNLSERAQRAQEALRTAAKEYQVIVDRVIADPRGRFVEQLRQAEERVAEAASRWALEYEEGAS